MVIKETCPIIVLYPEIIQLLLFIRIRDGWGRSGHQCPINIHTGGCPRKNLLIRSGLYEGMGMNRNLLTQKQIGYLLNHGHDDVGLIIIGQVCTSHDVQAGTGENKGVL